MSAFNKRKAATELLQAQSFNASTNNKKDKDRKKWVWARAQLEFGFDARCSVQSAVSLIIKQWCRFDKLVKVFLECFCFKSYAFLMSLCLWNLWNAQLYSQTTCSSFLSSGFMWRRRRDQTRTVTILNGMFTHISVRNVQLVMKYWHSPAYRIDGTVSQIFSQHTSVFTTSFWCLQKRKYFLLSTMQMVYHRIWSFEKMLIYYFYW